MSEKQIEIKADKRPESQLQILNRKIQLDERKRICDYAELVCRQAGEDWRNRAAREFQPQQVDEAHCQAMRRSMIIVTPFKRRSVLSRLLAGVGRMFGK